MKNHRKHLPHSWFNFQSDLQFAQCSSLLFLGHKLGQCPLTSVAFQSAMACSLLAQLCQELWQSAANPKHAFCSHFFYICIWTVPIVSYLSDFVWIFYVLLLLSCDDASLCHLLFEHLAFTVSFKRATKLTNRRTLDKK